MKFNLLNVPVTIQPTFWLFVLIFCFQAQIEPLKMVILAFVLLFSLLFHEFGHALAAQKFGCSPEITLENFGGYASYRNGGLTDAQELVITLCGPAFTALLIAVSSYLLKCQMIHVYEVNYFFFCTKKLNTYWLIVNLAPLSPLDGGKVAEYFLRKWFGERGRRYGLVLGTITAAMGTIYFFATESYMFAYLFLYYGWRNLQVYDREFPKRKSSDFCRYNEAMQARENGESEKAKAVLKQLSRSRDEYFKIRSLEGLAAILDQEGKVKEAYEAIAKVDFAKLTSGKWLLCKLAYSQGNYELIAKLSREIYEAHPTFETALLNAKTFAQLQNAEYAVGWLKTALQFDGVQLGAVEGILADPDLDPVRNHPEFRGLLIAENPSQM